MAESKKHRILKHIAMRWLQGTGCVAWAFEVSFPFIGIVDVMGLKESGDVYIVEAKVSRSDLRSDMREYAYGYGGKYSKLSKLGKYEASSKVDFIYYIVADGIDTSVLPTFVGLLDESGRVKRRAQRRRTGHSDGDKLASFVKISKALAWRKYGHVIKHEVEQLEYCLME